MKIVDASLNRDIQARDERQNPSEDNSNRGQEFVERNVNTDEENAQSRDGDCNINKEKVENRRDVL